MGEIVSDSKPRSTLGHSIPYRTNMDLAPGDRTLYINNLLIEESLKFLPQAVDHPQTDDFGKLLAEQLPQNSPATRRRFAEFIYQRYSVNGVMNRPLALFLKFCPSERARREVLWLETVRAMPMLRDISEQWLSKLPEQGGTKAELEGYLTARIGGRNPRDIIKRSVAGIRQFGHLRSDRPGRYIAVWAEPPTDTLTYAFSQIYPNPTAVRMELFKAESLWRALLWPAACLERMVLEGSRSGMVARVTRLDAYYQFVLEGTGEARLDRLLANWRNTSAAK